MSDVTHITHSYIHTYIYIYD